MKKTSLLFCVLMALAGVNGCASTADEETPLTAEEQYNQAYKEMEETSYKTAAKSFEKVELEQELLTVPEQKIEPPTDDNDD